ncbi:hypothetical protein FQA39_LY14575 [Lamprigera yunnana]|nr:hypothetical protein FQA39_LY14575 [Lamprigera yunnana]
MSFRTKMSYMNPYDLHKTIVNEYFLKKPGDTKLLQRDSSRDRTDFDILHQNHKFLWNDKVPDTWEAQFAKKYYDKLFKEYCIGDLSRYKENKIALRWRTEQEVILGKGQFICGNKMCLSKENLRTWEVNFAYMEQKEKKNALVKIRLCSDCSLKLNFHSKKRELKRIQNKRVSVRSKVKCIISEEDSVLETEMSKDQELVQPVTHSSEPNDSAVEESSAWENLKVDESKSRDEEMEDYLQELLL